MKFVFFVSLAGMILASAGTAHSQDVLGGFGDFDRNGTGETRIGVDDTSVDTYVVDCVNGVCEDNSLTPLALVDKRVILCSDGADALDCVNAIQVNIETSEPYLDVFVNIQRAGAEIHDVVYDNNKVGGVSSPGSTEGTSAVEEGEYVDISYALGMVTPKKTHTVMISSPAQGLGDGRSAVDSVEIVGMPISNRN